MQKQKRHVILLDNNVLVLTLHILAVLANNNRGISFIVITIVLLPHKDRRISSNIMPWLFS